MIRAKYQKRIFILIIALIHITTCYNALYCSNNISIPESTHAHLEQAIKNTNLAAFRRLKPQTLDKDKKEQYLYLAEQAIIDNDQVSLDYSLSLKKQDLTNSNIYFGLFLAGTVASVFLKRNNYTLFSTVAELYSLSCIMQALNLLNSSQSIQDQLEQKVGEAVKIKKLIENIETREEN